MRPVLRFVAGILALAVVCFAGPSRAGADDFKVIVNPKNPTQAIDREFLRDAYLKRATEWGDGSAIRPVDLSTRFAVRERFTQGVLRKTPAQLKSYWNQQIFSGKGTPPPEVDAIAALVDYVLANPGAVGYLPAAADPGRAKVVRVE